MRSTQHTNYSVSRLPSSGPAHAGRGGGHDLGGGRGLRPGALVARVSGHVPALPQRPDRRAPPAHPCHGLVPSLFSVLGRI